MDENHTPKQKHAARKVICKLLCFSLPFWAVILLYFHDDPFKVIRPYKNYDSDVTLNEECVGWNIYLNRRDSLPFNSFILGNSCTMAFPCALWESHLDSTSRAMRMPGNGERCTTILLKLRALEREGADLKNVLMVLDYYSIATLKPSTGYANILPADISGEHPLKVQLEFLQAFCMPSFLPSYLRYRLTGKVLPSMKHMNPHGRVRNSMNNDALNPRERMISQEGENYWNNRRHEFPPRNEKADTIGSVIRQPQKEVLEEIAGLLRRHHTSVRIIISPDWDQRRFNPADKAEMDSIYGKGVVYDFSGVNEFTEDYHNYYERAHYRPQLSERLLGIIYGKPCPSRPHCPARDSQTHP